jgi:hypothetical protein
MIRQKTAKNIERESSFFNAFINNTKSTANSGGKNK